MTIYTRPDELVFAESAKNKEVVDFPDISRGWGITFDQTEGGPPMEWFNSLSQRQDKATRYLIQRGISEWSSTEDYPVGGLVFHGGLYWQSLQDNRGNEPQENSNYWTKFADVDGLRGELGTSAFANIGNGANKVPDMSFFGASKTETGWTKLPNGLIFQWGRTTALSGSQTFIVNLPIANPSTTLSAFTSTYGTNASNTVRPTPKVGSFTNSSITIYNDGDPAVSGFIYYLVIGC